MKMIVAVDENWAIGCRGNLLVRIPADHRMFRQETLDKVVVLGRKTMDTFPGGQPLDGRVNIVLSRNPEYRVKGAVVVHATEELMEELKKYEDEDVYVISGETVYRQLLPFCDTVHVTKIDRAYEADAYFPDLDADGEWEIAASSDEMSYFDTTYHFLKYVRKARQA